MAQTCDLDAKIFTSSSAALGWDGISVAHGQMVEALEVDHASAPFHSVCMIVGQRVTWECDDGTGMRTVTTHPGQLCIFPAHLPTSKRMPRPYEFLTLTLTPEKMRQGLRLQQPVEFGIRHNVDDPQLQGLMQTLLAEAEASNPNGRLFVESLTLALSIHFVKQYAIEPERLPETQYHLSTRQLDRAMEFIESHLSQDISLETLAREIGLSKYYFCRQFKHATGQTPYQYVLQRRLERAKALLQQGGVNIIEVAHVFGFSDQSHFSRLFKKSYGITPGSFLRDAAEFRN